MTMRNNFAVVLLLVAALHFLSLWAAEPMQAGDSTRSGPSAGTPQTLDELLAALERVLETTNTPGMALTLVNRDEVLYSGGLGLAEVATQTRATANTLFRIGSTTKGFVALSALKLQAEGRLDLAAPLASLAPEVTFSNRWEATDPVRLVHLLEHTSGFDDIHFRDYANDDARPNNLLDVLAHDPDSRTSRWPPGTHMSYSNSGPAVVAYVISKVTGMPFEDYVQREWFDPLGMRSTTFFQPQASVPAAQLYQRDAVTPFAYWHIAMRPAGSVNSSANDMAHYVRMYLRRGELDGKQLISAVQLERMERPQSWIGARDGIVNGYGLGNYSTLDGKGFVWHGHNGGVQGGASDMSYNLEAGVGYALMVNAANGPVIPRATALIRNFLLGDAMSPTQPPVVAIPPELQQQYRGYYVPASPRVQLAAPIQRIGGVLKLDFAEDGAAALGAALGGSKQRFVGVTNRTLRTEEHTVASLGLLSESVGGDTLITVGTASYRQVPLWAAFGPLLLMLTGTCSGLVVLVFSVIWGLRHHFQALDISSTRTLRLWPLYSSLAVFAFFLMLIVMQNDQFLLGRYSVLGLHSGLLALLSVLAVLVPLLALLKVARRRHGAHRGVYALALFVVITQAGLMLCLAGLGMVPFVTWT